MTWSGIGGILAAELIKEVGEPSPKYARIDRLAIGLLLDCVYRRYNLDYLTNLLDRYLPEANDLRDGFLHVFRRLHSLLRHEYIVFFVLRGAQSATIDPSELKLGIHNMADLEEYNSGDNADNVETFKKQVSPDNSVIVSLEWSKDPDAGAAAETARKELQEIVDYLDFQSPTQRFELQPLALVTWKDKEDNVFTRLSPDTSGGQPPISEHEVSINPVWAGQLHGLTALRRPGRPR